MVVQWLERGYHDGAMEPAGGRLQRWSLEERGRIRFYAASFAVWMLSHVADASAAGGAGQGEQRQRAGQEVDALRVKYESILERLLQPLLPLPPSLLLEPQ